MCYLLRIQGLMGHEMTPKLSDAAVMLFSGLFFLEGVEVSALMLTPTLSGLAWLRPCIPIT